MVGVSWRERSEVPKLAVPARFTLTPERLARLGKAGFGVIAAFEPKTIEAPMQNQDMNTRPVRVVRVGRADDGLSRLRREMQAAWRAQPRRLTTWETMQLEMLERDLNGG
jgi:hypothetical protein